MLEKLFLKTQLLIDTCEMHLTESCCKGTEIEYYLTQHILIVFCAEMQNEIYSAVEKKGKVTNRCEIESFLKAASSKILRSVQKTDISQFIGFFGQEVKDKFNAEINDKSSTIYNNAVKKRHDVAHKQGSQISFQELKEAVRAGAEILNAVYLSLDITSMDQA